MLDLGKSASPAGGNGGGHSGVHTKWTGVAFGTIKITLHRLIVCGNTTSDG